MDTRWIRLRIATRPLLSTPSICAPTGPVRDFDQRHTAQPRYIYKLPLWSWAKHITHFSAGMIQDAGAGTPPRRLRRERPLCSAAGHFPGSGLSNGDSFQRCQRRQHLPASRCWITPAWPSAWGRILIPTSPPPVLSAARRPALPVPLVRCWAIGAGSWLPRGLTQGVPAVTRRVIPAA